ncbi:MAG: family 78 glycoside hydrolase catalytic domain [Lentisphaeria bacterium]|nr:family 78 glycoside hydrolase catalytic domain [Lentisphaeria bacterium]
MMLQITRMLTEYKENPIGMDEAVPRFCYTLTGTAKKQCFREITVMEALTGKILWESGKLSTPETTQIEYAGLPLAPRTAYTWQVTATDDAGNTASGKARFETGMMDTPWKAKWIAGTMAQTNCLPVQDTSKTFTLEDVPANARLYISALGLYEAEINGKPVTEDCLTPGWTDYYCRVQYQVYDVSSLLQKGENVLKISLAEGWYAGTISRLWNGHKPTWGEYPMVIAELRGDGQVLAMTDDSWTFTDSDTIFSDIYAGETVNRRIGYLFSRPATVCETAVKTVWTAGAPVRRMRTLRAQNITRLPDGRFIVDFGINFTGRERFILRNAAPGCAVIIRHGEMLREDGTLYTENLRSAAATTTYFAKGGMAEETYEPRFTFYGFRYLEVTGWPGELTAQDMEAVVLFSDLAETGKFQSSHELVNKLFSNIIRGQESNFVDVPTDCPQRDERLGWTGDTQVFANVAAYNKFSPEFYTKWIVDLNLGRQDELYPSFAPYPYRAPRRASPGENFFSAGWGDAGIICPWQLFRKYGDTRVCRIWLDHMERSLLRQIERHNGSTIVSDAFYGDWLNLDAPTDKTLIASAYLAGMMQLVARMASVCGDTARAERMKELRGIAEKTFAEKFFSADGEISCKTQTAALMTLHFDLVPEHAYRKTVDFLVNDIEVARDCHLSTGFLGTPLLLPVLTRIGRTDLAYRLLEQTTYPGWLFPVTNGATTMWERWNSWTPEQGFGEVSMNSFNHYAYGAVGEWFYETICGILPGEQGGFRQFRLAPEPGGSFTRACAEYDSLYGKIVSGWELQKDGSLLWNITVPFGTEATLVMPPGFTGDLPPKADAGSYSFRLMPQR